MATPRNPRMSISEVANGWVRMAYTDMNKQIQQFCRKNNTTPQSLATAFDIPMTEMNCILRNSGQISLTTFAKLLIASDHVLEVKPLHGSPLNVGGGIPRVATPKRNPNGGMVHPIGAMPLEGEERPTPPTRDARGRFVSRVANPTTDDVEEDVNLATVNASGLVDIIRKNRWDDGTINLRTANRQQLLNHIMRKIDGIGMGQPMGQNEPMADETEFGGEDMADDAEIDGMNEPMADETEFGGEDMADETDEEEAVDTQKFVNAFANLLSDKTIAQRFATLMK